MILVLRTLRSRSFRPNQLSSFLHSSSAAPSSVAGAKQQQQSGLDRSKRPKWIQQIFDDKRTYFERVSDIERCYVTNVAQDTDRRCFSFTFDNAPAPEHKRLDISYLALREACRCDSCFSYTAQAKINQLCELDINNYPSQFEFDKDNQLFHVTWTSDGHKSTFSGPWLYATFTKHPLFEGPKKRLWTGEEYMKNFQQFDFKEICTDQKTKLQFILGVCTWGLAKIVNAPKEKGALAELTSHINYVRQNTYGQYFEVENKQSPTNVAYHHGPIPHHVDQPWFYYAPGVQFLHCIRQAKNGGDNSFGDSYAISEYLRENEKQTFDALSQIPSISFNYTEDTYDAFLMSKRTTINRSEDGAYQQFHLSNHSFDSLRQLEPEKQDALLKGIRRFYDLLRSQRFGVRFKMSEGDIAVIDNMRVTHARDAFESAEARLLIGCYIDWDEMHSRRRLLQVKYFREELAKQWPAVD